MGRRFDRRHWIQKVYNLSLVAESCAPTCRQPQPGQNKGLRRTGGPNLSIGKWLVLRGVDEEKTPKPRAPAGAVARASVRRSGPPSRRAHYDWDSDATSDEDPGAFPQSIASP